MKPGAMPQEAPTQDTLYFAFGSNLHPPQMEVRCPDSRVVQPGLLEGYRLGFAGYSSQWGGGVATILPAPGQQVPGLLYHISPADLEKLNGFEGFPTVYAHLPVSVQGCDGASHPALTFEQNDPAPSAPSLRYFHQIWRSYKAFGLDEAHLLAAVGFALNGAAGGNGR